MSSRLIEFTSATETIFNKLIQPFMKNNLLLLASFLLVGTITRAQKQEFFFDVIYKDGKIGVLRAQEIKTETKSFKLLNIETNTTFLFITIHMESEVTTTQENGILMEGNAYRNASAASSK